MQNTTFFSFDNKTDNNLLNYKNRICFDQNSKKKYEKILSVLDPDNNGLTSSEVQSLWFEIKNSASQTAQNNVLNTNEATQFVKARFKNKQISVSNFIDFIKLVTDTVNKSFNKMNLTKHYNTQFSSELIGKKVAPNKKYTLVNLQRLYPKNKGYEVKSINGEFHVTKNGKDCIIYYIKCDGGASIDDKDNNLYTIENPDGTLNAIYNGDKLIGFDSHFNPSQQLKNKNKYHNGNEFYITKKGNSLGITNRSNFRVTIVDFDKILKNIPQFMKKDMINFLQQLPAEVLEDLSREGIRIKFDSEDHGDSAAYYRVANNTINLQFDYIHDAETLVHELGHAIDFKGFLNLNSNGDFNNNYKTIFEKEMAIYKKNGGKVNEQHKSLFNSKTTNSKEGAYCTTNETEMFAECYTLLMLGDCHSKDTIITHFPNTLKVVKNILEKTRKLPVNMRR